MEEMLPEGWEILRAWLPADLAGLARRHGFAERASGLQAAEVWLRLLLMHAGGGLSLEQTVLRARELGLAKISAVALFKRLRRAGPWLEELTRQLLAARPVARPAEEEWQQRVVVVDATDVQEPGSTGTAWRVHYQVRLGDLRCTQYELTDGHGGERLGRFRFAPKQIVLADRGYCHRAGVAQVLGGKAEVVVRLHPTGFPLENEAGAAMDLCQWVRTLSDGQPGERTVWFCHGGRRHRLRLCALRKSELATERAQKKQRRKARCAGRQPQADVLELAGYILVLTSLPAKAWPTERVLALYRYRWQVELVFKRLKSLLGLGHVPKSSDQSARAWMQAKILTALLIERVLFEAKFFSPWGFPWPGQPLAAVPRSA